MNKVRLWSNGCFFDFFLLLATVVHADFDCAPVPVILAQLGDCAARTDCYWSWLTEGCILPACAASALEQGGGLSFSCFGATLII